MSAVKSPKAVTPKLIRQEPNDEWLLEWLKVNNLSHLYNTIKDANICIEDLYSENEETIKSIASYKLSLKGQDLKLFVSSIIKYNNLQCLMKRNDELTSCIDNLEFTKNELDIKRSNDILYVQEKFKKIQRILKKRETILIREIDKKFNAKKNLLNEQILNLSQYRTKCQNQHKLLMENGKKKKKNREQKEENNECEYGQVDENMNTKVLLNEPINYDKSRFYNINKMSVEIPNYDDIISHIKRTGIILDDFDFNYNVNNNNSGYKSDNKPISNRLDCLCGTQLILTNVELSYKNNAKIYCNFCNFQCSLPHNGDIYHCPRGDIKLHPGGFDLCYLCGSKCFEARKAEKRRKQKERKRRKIAKHVHANSDLASIKKHKQYKQRDIKLLDRALSNIPGRSGRSNSSKPKPPSKSLVPFGEMRHHRSYSAIKSSQWEQTIQAQQQNMDKENKNDNMFKANPKEIEDFMYPSQLKKLMGLGYDEEKSRNLIIKYKGNMSKVMKVFFFFFAFC